MARPPRRYPRWTQAELDELRALHDAGEILEMQKRTLAKVVRANRPWWLRWTWRR